MKKYYVNVHYDVCRPVVVIAESESEAIQKAENGGDDVISDLYEEEWNLTESCVTDTEDAVGAPQPDEPCNECALWRDGFGCWGNHYNSTAMVTFGTCGHKRPKK